MHFGAKWNQVTLRRSKLRPYYVLIKSNSHGCLRLILLPVEPEVSLVALLLYNPCQLLRQECAPGSHHIGSPADQGYAEHMRAMSGRDDMDPPRQEPSRQEQQSMGSYSRGSSSQYNNPNLGWQNRPGQSVPAFPGSRIVPTRQVDPRDASM
jgi:hypothetical protein